MMNTSSAFDNAGMPDFSSVSCPVLSAGPVALNCAAKHSFQTLCMRLRPDLLRLALWLTHNQALADDVVQESLLRAWKSRHSLLNKRAAKAWLCKIVRNEYARTFERKRLALVDIDALIATDDPSLASDDDQEINDIREALRGLAEPYRRPLEMQVLLGYSVVEIAAQLHLSKTAVLTRLFRARSQLRLACGYDQNMRVAEAGHRKIVPRGI
jgi:RNA polymerase sigma-70 factor, ECF subfamily